MTGVISDVGDYTVIDRTEVQLQNVEDSKGRPCTFDIEIHVTSSHGMAITERLGREIRLAAFDAVGQFDMGIKEDDS